MRERHTRCEAKRNQLDAAERMSSLSSDIRAYRSCTLSAKAVTAGSMLNF